MNNSKKIVWILMLLISPSILLYGQGVPNEIVYEPDDGGYVEGYNPTKKLGTVDLSSNASNEPFRHLIWGGKVIWDKKNDYRNLGFKAMTGDQALYKPKVNRYIDLNEAQFREGNPIYSPDPNATGAGQTFSCFNVPFPSVTISNIGEDSKFNPFLLTEPIIDKIARSISNPSINFMRWDIESFNPEGLDQAVKGRQVWEGGKYRHRSNGGNNQDFQDMDDLTFFYFVMSRWSYVFSELLYKTKFFSGGQVKIWMYGTGPVQLENPGFHRQFEDNGDIFNQWKYPKFVWNTRNNYNNRTVAEVADYMEPSDLIPTYGTWAVAQLSTNGQWISSEILLLDKQVQGVITKGSPTRFSITDMGDAGNNQRRVRVSLRGQDGSLRLCNQDNYGIFFESWRGKSQVNFPRGQHTLEMTVPIWEPIRDGEDGVVIVTWNNMYCQRYQEPQKLGFINWEPAPRTENLFITTIFEQRIYDAMVAFTNLQNYGVIHWDASSTEKLNARVRESLILSNKKIAPYKGHIENQTLCQTGVSIDNGASWVEGGYPTRPFQQCYNGWWMQQQQDKKVQFPILIATYNAQLRTILVAHLTNRMEGNMNYKIKVKVPNVGSYTFDLTSTKNLKYTVFRL